LNCDELSILGYYLRPSLSYKATTIAGRDEELQSILEDGCTMTFTDLLRNSLNKVNDLQKESEEWGIKFAAGETDNIHQVMIASQKADIALQLATAIRQKIMDAYTEIMRMQI
jgi:flagellar hook-basal body complex protein FliE